jgi:hypothetical protein
VTFQLAPDRPLVAEMSVGGTPVLTDVDPVLVMTVGSRNLNDKAGWVAFFDNPPRRPHQTHRATLARTSARVESVGRRTSVVIGGLECGPFRGEMRFAFFPNARIVQATAELTTTEDGRAITYDAGLVMGDWASPSWKSVAWVDSKRDVVVEEHSTLNPAAPHHVRQRAIIATGNRGGSVALVPPPHQYLYPLDFAENFGFVWHGVGWRDVVERPAFGVRQTIEGDKRYVPWVNAPPGTRQRLSVFYLLTRGGPAEAFEQVGRYTRGDRFKPLDGYKTFTSHYHVEHTLDFVAKQKEQQTNDVPKGLESPGFVRKLKSLGIDIAHLAEFHVGHTPEMNATRLQLLKTLHDECARLSEDAKFLLLPGEEPNVHLGGHWISFFPKPVYWTLMRGKDQPFSEQVDGFGTAYHVGSAADVLKLMDAERGLMWTAHPRIKGSFGFPDAYRNSDYFKSDRFLGGAWKAMPADDSLPRLGTRVLDLLDDMNNWSDATRYAPGEVDIFKLEPDYELYGHANINYVKLDRIPRFGDGWQPLLDALRAGDFFVTTGEVLIPTWSVDRARGELTATLESTFPLAFAEVVAGDGASVQRTKLQLDDAESFASRTVKIPIDLRGKKWVRFEAWDVATNGAFTQPVRLDNAGSQ